MNRSTPRSYFSSEADELELIEVIFEQGDRFEIFWYHWPRDGVFPWPDYEPVVMVYNSDGTLCLLMVRRGWRFRIYHASELFYPIEVLFDSIQHHPYIKTLATDDFELKKTRHEPRIYEARTIRDKEIPSLNIEGPLRKSIYDKTREVIERLCG